MRRKDDEIKVEPNDFENGGSKHSKDRERKGNVGNRSKMDGMPRIVGATLVYKEQSNGEHTPHNKLLRAKSSKWEGTLRRKPDRWTTNIWQGVYEFLIEREGLAFKMDRFMEGKFSNLVNLKNGFAIFKCKDARARTILEFLVPILYPKKSTQVTITMDKTIFGAIIRKQKVDWSLVMKDVV